VHYRVVMFGNKDTTREFMEYIHNHLIKIDIMVTADAGKYQRSISGHANIVEFADSLGIKSFIVNDYSLRDFASVSFFKNNTFDIGISVGWQRLIPQDILDRFQTGIFGFHGSAGHLPYGRGRSPLNWSIINGHKRFINNLFKYSPKADAGGIHSVKSFEINQFDTIQTLQYKTVLVGKEQIAKLINDYKKGTIHLEMPNSNLSSWYPKRNPDDGKLSLMLSTEEIYNRIRAVTHPFPGAYLMSKNDKQLKIWEAYPFDYFIDTFHYKVGEVIEVFNRDLILKTVDGSLIIKKYEFDEEIKKGDVFC
jgi:methionyl-tRNA formyltransferase